MDVTDLYRVDPSGAEGAVPGSEDALASVVLHAHVQPGAGRAAVVGRHGTALKVRVAAPPERGRANEATAALLAEAFGLKGAQVELVNGAASRAKQFRLSGLELDEFDRRLEQVVAEGYPPTGRRSQKHAT